MNDNLQDALEQLREALFRPSELAFGRVCALVAQAAEAHGDDARRVLLPYAEGALADWPDALRTLDAHSVGLCVEGPLPELVGLARRLDLRTGNGLHYRALGALAALQHIHTLCLWRCTPNELAPLLASDHLTGLQSLEMHDLPWGNAELAALAAMPAFGRVQTLTLSVSGTQGGPFLDALLPRLAGLTTLELHFVKLDPDRLGRVLAALPPDRLRRLAITRADLATPCGELIAHAPGLSALRSLDLDSNALGDLGVEALSRAVFWPLLEELALSGNGVTDDGLAAAFGERPALALRRLALDDTPISEMGLFTLFTHLRRGGLRHLGLNSCKLGPTAPALAQPPATLESLGLRKNGLHDTAASLLAQATSLTRLTALDLGLNGLTPAGVATLLAAPHLQSLERLELGWNPLNDDLAPALLNAAHLTALRMLHLQHTAVGDATADAIAHAPHLAELDELVLSHTLVGDPGAEALARAPHLAGLVTLALDHCPVGSAGLLALVDAPWFPSLESLDLESCTIDDEAIFGLLARADLATLPPVHLGDNPISNPVAALLRVEVLEDDRLKEMFAWASGLERRLGVVALILAAEQPEATTTLFELLARWPADSPRLASHLLPLLTEQLEDFPVQMTPPASWVELLDRPGDHALDALGAFALLDAPPNHLGPAEVVRLAASPAVASLRVLDLSENAIGADGVRAIAQSPRLANLEGLLLRRCGLDDAALKPLTRALELTHLTTVDLSHNALTEAGARAIARAWWLPTVHHLFLDGNPIGTAGAGLLTRARDARALELLTVGACGVELEALAGPRPTTCAVASGPPWRVLTPEERPRPSTDRDADQLDAQLQALLAGEPSESHWTALLREVSALHQLGVAAPSAWIPTLDAALDRWPTELRKAPWDCVDLMLEGRSLPWFQLFRWLHFQRQGEGDAFVQLASRNTFWHLRWLSFHAVKLGDLALRGVLRHGGLPPLELLGLHNCELSDAALASIARCPALARLERLILTWNADLSHQGVRHLASSPHLNHLKLLAFHESRITDVGARHLATSPTLQRLEALLLTDCAITDAGVALLLHPDHLPALSRLELNSNPLTNAAAHHIAAAAERRPLAAVDVSRTRIDAEGRALLKALEASGRIGELLTD